MSVVSVWMAACSHKSTPPTTMMNIPPTGGTVTTGDGASVVIPDGAISGNTSITMGGEPDSVSIPDFELVGPAYRLGPEGQQFATPVTVTVPFDGSQLPSDATSADIVIMTAPVGGAEWTELPTTLIDDGHVSAPTSHFSDFVAAVHKHKVDMAGGNVDLSMSSNDLSSADDLSSGSDLAMCPKTYNAMTCGFTAAAATCGGQGYMLNCQQTQCYCSKLNMGGSLCPKLGADANTLNCPDMAALQTMWTTCCMFP
jgi:hypothetical protein